MNTSLLLCLAILVGINCVQLPGCPRIISRSEWNARPAVKTTWMSNSVTYAIIHHATGSRCFSTATCKTKVKSYQNYHMDTKGWWDIGYNFVVGEDGNIYEGRGWNVRGAHAGSSAINRNSIGICVIGDFSNTVPNTAAQNAVKSLLNCAKNNGKLASSYTLCGHRDVRSTQCPGQSFYNLIKTWSNYNENSKC
ncbi:peptidoglycan-recognition protein SC2-like [Mercenaria mercenaria]|uniref:peptidoglycan-recognition protein SC2-like n=1 Tax=Mercenaria mercenaria TaxID=6596 RepID=UPI00234F0E6E|nr:peptidoglycan-recognition protein SC2-like [Mercenaria mercenaria]XP_045185304.2 peptidoglycan-recognition protein SC2-like [Mercenaria mercenaria]